MTNLPITSSTPQAAPSGKPSGNANDSAEPGTQPFGEVLARQIAPADGKSVKASSQLAVELAARIGKIDPKVHDKALPEAATTAAAMPTDMLAALLPQIMNTPTPVATPAADAPANDSKADAITTLIPGPSAKPAAKIEIAAKTETAGPVQNTDVPKGELPTATPARSEALPFNAELAARTAANMKPETAPRELAAISEAPVTQLSAAATGAMQAPAATIATTQAAQLKVEAPVNQPHWGDEFGQKITWLASSGTDQTAELHLNPPQLGPLDVVIKVSGDQATALFTSPHAAVREAVEQAIPKLRDMMADNGIMLGNATVSDQTPRDQGRPEASRNTADSGETLHDTAPAGMTTTARVSPIARHNGIVDTFA